MADARSGMFPPRFRHMYLNNEAQIARAKYIADPEKKVQANKT
jgi:hypothetical protein